MAVVFFQNLADRQDVFAALDEGSGDPVHVHAAAEFDIVGVCIGNSRQVDGMPGTATRLRSLILPLLRIFRMDVLAFDADNFR